ncbi:MAG TPA: hypothetical protein VLA19_22285 [Herpetosiphonaceae bacterium]|nr:hypothetical protein [Herpetosiphonaceae bacterium]
MLTLSFNDISITDVPAMTVQQALAYVSINEVVRKLQAMRDGGMPTHQAGQQVAQKRQRECHG